MIRADASGDSRVPRERLSEVAQVSRTVRQYLAELEQENPVPNAETISTTDPDAAWCSKGGPARLAYYDNYLIDTNSRVILAVEATPARFHPRDRSGATNARAGGKAGSTPTELKGRQGLWQWRVLGLVG